MKKLALLMILFVLAGCIASPQAPKPVNVSPTEEYRDQVTEKPLSEPIEVQEPEDIRKDTQEAQITQVNDIPIKQVTEGELVEFPNLKAQDPDGDELTYTFKEPLNRLGQWKTKVGDAGTYNTVIQVSDGTTTTTQQIRIIVDAQNRPPVISTPNILRVREGETINAVEASDPEGSEVKITYEGWKDLPYTTTSNDAGLYTIRVTASDGKLTTKKDIRVTVTDVNNPPSLAEMQTVEVTEGDKIILAPEAEDADGDTLTLYYNLPFNNRGEWQTKDGDRGEYTTQVRVSDGKLSDSKEYTIKVLPRNQPPTLTVQKEVRVTEGDTVTLDYSVEDIDGDEVDVTISGWMTSQTKETSSDDQGQHAVTITASDGQETVTEHIKVIVENVNQAPQFLPGSFE